MGVGKMSQLQPTGSAKLGRVAKCSPSRGQWVPPNPQMVSSLAVGPWGYREGKVGEHEVGGVGGG